MKTTVAAIAPDELFNANRALLTTAATNSFQHDNHLFMKKYTGGERYYPAQNDAAKASDMIRTMAVAMVSKGTAWVEADKVAAVTSEQEKVSLRDMELSGLVMTRQERGCPQYTLTPGAVDLLAKFNTIN